MMSNFFHNFYVDVKKRLVAQKLRKFTNPYRLHLGCGAFKFDGWINIDSNPKLDSVDLVWDLSLGIPVEDASCGLIYCEHFLEHLTVEQGVVFLRECRRALQSNGVLRIAMPSLDVLIEKCYLETWRDQDWLTWPEYNFIKTKAEMLNIVFRWWEHQWLYDREELHRRLLEAGFNEINDFAWGESTIIDFKNRETRKDSNLICEATKVEY